MYTLYEDLIYTLKKYKNIRLTTYARITTPSSMAVLENLKAENTTSTTISCWWKVRRGTFQMLKYFGKVCSKSEIVREYLSIHTSEPH